MEWPPYFLIVSAIFLSLALADNQCHPTPRCFCQNANYGEYEYQCDCTPQKNDCNDVFYMRIKPLEEILISCNKEESWPALVQELNVSGSYRKMSLKNCTLPDTSFGQLLQDFGIEGVAELQLDFLKNAQSTFRDGYFDGPASLKHLYIQHSSLISLPDAIFQGLPKLEMLMLNHNELGSISAALFQWTPRLWYLELGRNNLTHLDGGVFKHLSNLTLLNAYSNHLRALTREVFATVPKLKFLDVQSNQIQSLDEDVFEDLPFLTDVNLSFNNISYLSSSIFANKTLLRRIRAVQAQGTNVTALPPNFFYNLTTLKTLKLDFNNLEYLSGNLFQQTHNLTELTFKNNKMVALAENVFAPTSNLEILDLGHNKLTSLNATVFRSLTKLVHLYLDNNLLVYIDRNAFTSLTSLNRLYLQNNHLTSLQLHIFSSLINLKEINLSHNQVNMFAGLEDFSVLNNCKDLRTINLSHNNVSKIYRDWLIVFVHLTELDLSYNQLNMLNYEDMDFISSKVAVDLSYNNISVVNLRLGKILERVTGSMRIRSVKLDDNPIACDCRAYDLAKYMQRQAQIKGLTLSANTLQCIEPAELANSSLTQVDVYDLICPLDRVYVGNVNLGRFCPSNCSCFLRPADDALVFNCDAAMLRKLPAPPMANTFTFNKTELLLSNNQLTSVAMLREWLQQVNVTRLSLASNRLQSRDLDELQLPPSLKVLELHDNKLIKLDNTVIERLNHSSLTNITLYQNPWKCDCELSGLVTYLRTRYKKINRLHNITCAISGKPLVELSLEDLCHFSITVIIICISLASFGLLFGTLIFFYYRYENYIKVWLFSHKICLWLVTEKEVDRDKQYDAFVSYSHLDEPFVVQQLVPQLEGGDNPFKLCIHIRDWPIGGYIPNQIVKSVESSRRTIIILSPNFLTSSWGQVEFREAYLKMVKERCPRVIIILLKDVGDTSKLYPELKACLTMNTYLKWGDPWFWQKLRYAMPHPQRHSKERLSARFPSANGLLQMSKLNNNLAMSYFEPSKEKEKIDDVS